MPPGGNEKGRGRPPNVPIGPDGVNPKSQKAAAPGQNGQTPPNGGDPATANPGSNLAPVAVDDYFYFTEDEISRQTEYLFLLEPNPPRDSEDPNPVGDNDPSPDDQTFRIDLIGQFFEDGEPNDDLDITLVSRFGDQNALRWEADDYDYLKDGETLTITFTYSLIDEYGKRSASDANVTIVVTGENDDPDIMTSWISDQILPGQTKEIRISRLTDADLKDRLTVVFETVSDGTGDRLDLSDILDGAPDSITVEEVTDTRVVISGLDEDLDAWVVGKAFIFVTGPDPLTRSAMVSVTVTDEFGGTDKSVGTITVGTAPPIPDPESYETLEDVPLFIELSDLLDGDFDPLGMGLTITGTTDPSLGTLTLSSDGERYVYRPNEDVSGRDSFEYTVATALGSEARATVTIDIAPVEDPPDDLRDTFSTDEDVGLFEGQLLRNATDPDTPTDGIFLTKFMAEDLLENPESFKLFTLDDGSFIAVNRFGEFRFIPAARLQALDDDSEPVPFRFTATLSDSIDGSSGRFSDGRFLILVEGRDDPLIVPDGPITLGTVTSFDPRDYFVDADDPVVVTDVTVLGGPDGVDFQIVNGEVVIPSDALEQFPEDEIVTFQLGLTFQGIGDPIPVTVTFRGTNSPPFANETTIRPVLFEDTFFDITPQVLRDNILDVDSTSFGLVDFEAETPRGGSLTNVGGALRYTPKQDFNGVDIITVYVTDFVNQRVKIEFDLSVFPVDDAPTIEIEEESLGLGELQTGSAKFTVRDPDSLTNPGTPSAMVTAIFDSKPENATYLVNLAKANNNWMGDKEPQDLGDGTIVVTGTPEQVEAYLDDLTFTGLELENSNRIFEVELEFLGAPEPIKDSVIVTAPPAEPVRFLLELPQDPLTVPTNGAEVMLGILQSDPNAQITVGVIEPIAALDGYTFGLPDNPGEFGVVVDRVPTSFNSVARYRLDITGTASDIEAFVRAGKLEQNTEADFSTKPLTFLPVVDGNVQPDGIVRQQIVLEQDPGNFAKDDFLKIPLPGPGIELYLPLSDNDSEDARVTEVFVDSDAFDVKPDESGVGVLLTALSTSLPLILLGSYVARNSNGETDTATWQAQLRDLSLPNSGPEPVVTDLISNFVDNARLAFQAGAGFNVTYSLFVAQIASILFPKEFFEDAEGDPFTVLVRAATEGVRVTIADNGEMRVSFAEGFSGDAQVRLRAIDQFGAESENDLVINILNVTQALLLYAPEILSTLILVRLAQQLDEPDVLESASRFAATSLDAQGTSLAAPEGSSEDVAGTVISGEISPFSLFDRVTDSDNDVARIELVEGPERGALDLNEDGTFTFTIDSGERGFVTFVIQAVDAEGFRSAPTTITLALVAADNTAPVAQDDMIEVAADAVTAISEATLLANDFDANADPLRIEILENPVKGLLAPNDEGGFDYAAFEGQDGTDSFTYRLRDPEGLVSGVATVTLVIGGNTAPVSPNDGRRVLLAHNDDQVFLNLDAPIDPDFEEFTITITALPSFGRILDGFTLSPLTVGDMLSVSELQALIFQGDNAQTADIATSLTYQLADPSGGTTDVTVTIEGRDDIDLSASVETLYPVNFFGTLDFTDARMGDTPYSLSLENGVVAIGATAATISGNSGAGHVSVYRKDASGVWQATNASSQIDGFFAGDGVGKSVLLNPDGNELLVAFPYETNFFSNGAIGEYAFNGSTYVTTGDTYLEGGFVNQSSIGASLARDGDLTITGATANDAFALIFDETRISGTTGPFNWARLDSDPSSDNLADRQGEAVAVIDGALTDYAFVGSPGIDTVHVRSSTTGLTGFSVTQTLTDPEGGGSDFGAFLLAADGLLFVGAPLAGKVYVYNEIGGSWSLVETLVAPDGTPGDAFGTAMAYDLGTLVIGAPLHEVDGAAGAGAVYAFTRAADDTFDFTTKYVDPVPAAGDNFGASVAVNRSDVAGAAPGDDGSGYADGGAVIVFSTAARDGLKAMSLTGDSNDDILVAADGNDSIVGEDGSDFLRGNDGQDTLTGGSGSDGFAFDLGEDDFDIITDFVDGEDLILIPAGTFTSGFVAIDNGTGTDLVYDGKLVARLEAYNAMDFTIDDVGFF